MFKPAVLVAIAALTAALTSNDAGAQRQADLPPDTATYRASDLPGYALAQRNCLTCHSAQYVITQPPTSARPYWEATLKKMKTPFGAVFPDEEIPPMVDYLVKTYGAERQSSRPPR